MQAEQRPLENGDSLLLSECFGLNNTTSMVKGYFYAGMIQEYFLHVKIFAETRFVDEICSRKIDGMKTK